MAFFSSKKESKVESPAEEAKRKIQEQTAQELGVADVTQLVQNMTQNCFDICYPSNPGPVVTAADKKCTEQCVQKYMHAWNLLSQTYVNRMQK